MPGFCNRCGQESDDIYNHTCPKRKKRGGMEIVHLTEKPEEKETSDLPQEPTTPPVTPELDEQYPNLR